MTDASYTLLVMCRAFYGGRLRTLEEIERKRDYQRRYWDAKGWAKRKERQREKALGQLEQVELEIQRLQEAI